MTAFYGFCTIFSLFLFFEFKTGEKHGSIYHPENFRYIEEKEINKIVWKFLSRFHAGVIYSVSTGWKENKRCPELKEEMFAKVIPTILLYLCYLHYLLFFVVAGLTIFLCMMYRDLSLCCKFSVVCTVSYALGTIAVDAVIGIVDRHRERKKYD